MLSYSDTQASQAKCEASLEAAAELFPLSAARISVPCDVTLGSLLRPFFARLVAIYDLRGHSNTVLAEPHVLKRMLSAVFDKDVLALVIEDDSETLMRMLAGLDDHVHASLLAQAVAGLVVIFRQLDATAVELTRDLLAHELQLFAHSQQRRDMLERIAASPALKTCYAPHQVTAMLRNGVLHDQDHEESRPGSTPTAVQDDGDDIWRDSVASGNRSFSNMGVPSGLQFMAIN